MSKDNHSTLQGWKFVQCPLDMCALVGLFSMVVMRAGMCCFGIHHVNGSLRRSPARLHIVE